MFVDGFSVVSEDEEVAAGMRVGYGGFWHGSWICEDESMMPDL